MPWPPDPAVGTVCGGADTEAISWQRARRSAQSKRLRASQPVGALPTLSTFRGGCQSPSGCCHCHATGWDRPLPASPELHRGHFPSKAIRWRGRRGRRWSPGSRHLSIPARPAPLHFQLGLCVTLYSKPP